MKRAYELLEHTADIGIKLKADNPEELLKNAALAMFDVMAEKICERESAAEKFLIKESGENLEDVFIRWLNELLSLSAAKGRIFRRFEFKRLDEHGVEAVAEGEDIKDYKIKTEIKAATYHELEIKKEKTYWQARVIFDV